MKNEKIKNILASDITLTNAKNVLQTLCEYCEYDHPIYTTDKIDSLDNNPLWKTTVVIKQNNVVIIQQEAIARHKLITAEKQAALECIKFFRSDNGRSADRYASRIAPARLYYPSPEELFLAK